MNKQHHFPFFFSLILIGGALALWASLTSPRAYANVTLVGFTGNTLPGQPEVYLEWETATEFDTLGFFITRGDSFGGTFTRVSEFIPHEGDTVVGAMYDWIDENTVLNRVYLYKLEEITTNQTSVPYGPITVTTGSLVGVDPTPTHTPTPTRTPTSTPTVTPAAPSNTTAATSSAPSSNNVIVTPRVVTGATVTPRPTTLNNSSNPSVVTTPVANVAGEQQTLPVIATALPSLPNAVEATMASQPPETAAVVQENAQAAAEPTLVPADAAPINAAPAIVVTEASSSTTATPATSNGSTLLLVAAAFLLLSAAFFILRQVRP